jgi:hypothetical protein|uniref:Uncharacterized protein n=1 Tax=viral metagenome TaxID=1070528 RepID=A0A6C0IWN9_9ZZZZ
MWSILLSLPKDECPEHGFDIPEHFSDGLQIYQKKHEIDLRTDDHLWVFITPIDDTCIILKKINNSPYVLICGEISSDDKIIITDSNSDLYCVEWTLMPIYDYITCNPTYALLNAYPHIFTKKWFCQYMKNLLDVDFSLGSTKCIQFLKRTITNHQSIDHIIDAINSSSDLYISRFNSIIFGYRPFREFMLCFYKKRHNRQKSSNMVRAFMDMYGILYNRRRTTASDFIDDGFHIHAFNNSSMVWDKIINIIGLGVFIEIFMMFPETFTVCLNWDVLRIQCHNLIQCLIPEKRHYISYQMDRICASLLMYTNRYPIFRGIYWNPENHIFATNNLKKTITTFRVGTYFLTRLLDTRECKRSLSWLLWAWTMPYIGLEFMSHDHNPIWYLYKKILS